MKPGDARRRAWRFGHWAEHLCAWRLRLAGYRILARRFKTPVGEIDLIARRRDVLIFIEVKARTDADTALDSVRPTQQRRIERAALVFVQKQPRLNQLGMRFDVMVVRPWRPPHHIVDAWRPET